MVPNVLKAYAFDIDKLNAFTAMYNDLMLGDSGLSKLEREMIAVVVSSINKCWYCLVAHGAAVRQVSGDPVLGERMAFNWRTAKLDDRQRAMLLFAEKLTTESHKTEDSDRQALRDVQNPPPPQTPDEMRQDQIDQAQKGVDQAEQWPSRVLGQGLARV